MLLNISMLKIISFQNASNLALRNFELSLKYFLERFAKLAKFISEKLNYLPKYSTGKMTQESLWRNWYEIYLEYKLSQLIGTVYPNIPSFSANSNYCLFS